MDPYVFRLPDIGEGVIEAEIEVWHVAIGDVVEEDQLLVDVMTDKATVEMTSPVAGRVTTLCGIVGDKISVGSPLIEFETGATTIAAPAPPNAQTPAPIRQEAPPTPPASRKPSPLPEPDPSTRSMHGPLASPYTRRVAYERGVSLDDVVGTGPLGRITEADLDRHVAGRDTPAPGWDNAGVTETKIVGMRRIISERMQNAARRIPHFSYVEECDLTDLEVLRRDLNERAAVGQQKLTLLPFFMRAIAQLVPAFPNVNARFDDDAGILRSHDHVHIGIATQTLAGLMVPVVRHVESLDLWDCARELARMTSAARDSTATPSELSGSTITLTSLGALGGIVVTPIINYPEVAVVGPNKLVQRPVVKDGAVVIRTMMNISSSFDHRIIDGHEAARFIQALKELLEHPASLVREGA